MVNVCRFICRSPILPLTFSGESTPRRLSCSPVRTKVIIILNSRLSVDFLSQDVAIVLNCCQCHCRRREKGVADDRFDVAAADKDQRCGLTTLAICFIGDSWTKQRQLACLSHHGALCGPRNVAALVNVILTIVNIYCRL